MAGSLLVTLVVFTVLPFFHKRLKVKVEEPGITETTQVPLPEKPQKVLVTALYEMEEGSKKISAIYIEIYHVGSSTVSYFEVPADTKVNLSESLYKSLQTYAPELPQYLKLSNMAESFSEAYGLTGCNRILSEVLGISLTEYARADAVTLAEWMELPTKEKNAEAFFTAYTEWVSEAVSSLTAEELWTYYENRQKLKYMTMEEAPGSREKDGYLISGKRSKERLEELVLRPESQKEQQKEN